MVCYAVPAATAIAVYCLRKTKKELGEKAHYHWLNLLLFGATIFGVVDHLWNGELLFVSEMPLMDIALGVAITVTVFLAWGLIVVLDKQGLLSRLQPSRNTAA